MWIYNATQARIWLNSWGNKPSKGVLAETLAELQKSFNISVSYGHWEHAQEVAEAIMVLDRVQAAQ